MKSAHTEIPPDTVLPAPPLPNPADVALFLDIDGTLLDFAAHWNSVVVDPALAPLLRTLLRRLDGALALVSGRTLSQIDSLFDLPDAAIAGQHGAQLRSADGIVLAATADSAHMISLRRRAHALTASCPGVVIEEKPDALALHYRAAPAAAAAMRIAAESLAHEAGPAYALLEGDHVIELRPVGADKGAALASLMRNAPFADRVPWMIGDDRTDEYAFVTAQTLGGIGVIVGTRRPTAARYALADPAAARGWLASLSRHTPAPVTESRK
jgi:trehalose 6-phosphate phosphatase